MPRPIHFEVHAEDLDRAQAFYETVLDWLAQVKDTEGNIFGMMQNDPNAR